MKLHLTALALLALAITAPFGAISGQETTESRPAADRVNAAEEYRKALEEQKRAYDASLRAREAEIKSAVEKRLQGRDETEANIKERTAETGRNISDRADAVSSEISDRTAALVERMTLSQLGFIKRLELIAEKTQNRIGAIRVTGGNTSASERLLEEALSELAEAKNKVARLGAMLGSVSDNSTLRIAWNESGKAAIAEINSHIREAHRLITEAVAALKAGN